MTLKELIQRAIDIASQGQAETSVDAEVVAEALLPAVFNEVGERAARTPRLRTTLRRTKTLAVVSGTAALSSDVLTSYIDEANLLDPADRTKLYSLVPWDQMTTGQLDQRLGHFAVEGESTLHVIEPATAYDPATGLTISLRLTIPCAPAIPAVVTDPVVVIDEVVDDLITTLAEALKLKIYARR